jgi:hypothetical protein
MWRDATRRSEMTTSNVDAIYAEYPFLERIYSRKSVDRMQVTRWTAEFLDRASTVYFGYSEMTDTHTILLLDKDGNTITRVGEYKRSFLFWEWKGLQKETVREALIRIGEESARKVYYGLYDRETFYRLPRGFTSAYEWNEALIAADRAILRTDDGVAA